METRTVSPVRAGAEAIGPLARCSTARLLAALDLPACLDLVLDLPDRTAAAEDAQRHIRAAVSFDAISLTDNVARLP